MRLMSRCARSCVPLAVLGLLALGCGSGGVGGGGGDRDTTYRAYAQNFGDLLMKDDFAGAYDLCSSHLKSKMTLEQFMALHRQARTDYGKAAKASPSINFTDPKLLKDQRGWPEGAQRQARVFVNFHKDANDDSPGGDYSLGLNIVLEDGKDLVGAMDYGIH